MSQLFRSTFQASHQLTLYGLLFFALMFSSSPVFAGEGSDCLERSETLDTFLGCIEKDILRIPVEQCAEAINGTTRKVKRFAYDKFLTAAEGDLSYYARDGLRLAKGVFKLRNTLRQRLQYYYDENLEVSPGCVAAIRTATRYFRFTEELLVELYTHLDARGALIAAETLRLSAGEVETPADKQWQIKQQRIKEHRRVIVDKHRMIEKDFSEHDLQLMINGDQFPDFLQVSEGERKLNLKSGDMLLVRTTSFVSGTIARVGDDQGHFSHLAMVYVDNEGKVLHDGVNPGKRGQVYIVESLIETGVIYWKFEDWRQRKTDKETGRRYSDHARGAIYRLREPYSRYADEMAKRAIQLSVHHTKVFDDRYKKRNRLVELDYDFHMEMDNTDKIFCAELARVAACMGSNDLKAIYETARGDDRYADYKGYVNNECKVAYEKGSGLILPTYPSGFEKFSNHPFLEKMGITANRSFAPIDLEVEPKVDLVAEWRNPTLTRETRASDAVFERIMKWMYEDNYAITPPLKQRLMADVAYIGRRIPLLRLKREELRLSTPMGFLETFITLDEINQAISDEVYPAEQQYFEENGVAMDFKDLLRNVENYRAKDCVSNQASNRILWTKNSNLKVTDERLFRLHHYMAPFSSFESGGTIRPCSEIDSSNKLL